MALRDLVERGEAEELATSQDADTEEAAPGASADPRRHVGRPAVRCGDSAASGATDDVADANAQADGDDRDASAAADGEDSDVEEPDEIGPKNDENGIQTDETGETGDQSAEFEWVTS